MSEQGEQELRVIGFNDERTTCDRCGRVELRGTVIVADDAGELGRYGSTCVNRVLPQGHSRVTRDLAVRIEEVRRAQCWAELHRARRLLERDGDLCQPRAIAVRLLRSNDRVRALHPDEIAAAATLRQDCIDARAAAEAGRAGAA